MHKVFVSFHHANDQKYKEGLVSWAEKIKYSLMALLTWERFQKIGMTKRYANIYATNI